MAKGSTDDEASLLSSEETSVAGDPEVRTMVYEIAAKLSVRRPRSAGRGRSGGGPLTSLPYRGSSDEMDLDRTLESLASHPVPEDRDFVVRERRGARSSVVLLVDVSGSMRGERMRTAAATVAALARELVDHRLAVLAFWSDAAWIQRLNERSAPFALLDALLALPTKGLTNLSFPLAEARRELSTAPARGSRVLLLSDCVHNAGPDPRRFAAGLTRLDVLLDSSGECDPQLGAELARLGHGRMQRARTHRDVGPALSSLLNR